jgi:ABC-type glycerol-3-phosphate transport system permease component
MYTVSLALQQFKNAFYYRPELVLAITMLVILPITIIFLFLQKFFLQGVSIGGDKG